MATFTMYDVRPRAEARGFMAWLFSGLLWVQGVYYFLTGVWPLLSIETFILVTGEKTDHLVTGNAGDHWLVMTVGVLVAAIAVALLVAAVRLQKSVELAVLGLCCSGGLLAIDVIYVARQVIPPIYLADAAIEGVFFLFWSIILIAFRLDQYESNSARL